MFAIHGAKVGALPDGLGEGTFRVELVSVEDSNELMLQRKINETAQRRGAKTVLVGDVKRRRVPPVDKYVSYVPEQTYCYAVFAVEPV